METTATVSVHEGENDAVAFSLTAFEDTEENIKEEMERIEAERKRHTRRIYVFRV